MKKILNKVGNRYFTTCTHCGCYFTYDEEDIELLPSGNTNHFSRFVTCPGCNCYIKQENNQVKHIETLEL